MAADEADRIIEQQSDDIEALRSRLAAAEKERDSWRDTLHELIAQKILAAAPKEDEGEGR